jgi:hypothetical protein
MIRSYWMAPAALVLASAGLARSQAIPAETAPKEHFVTIQEVGSKPARCKLLKSWYEPDGTKAYQVQAVETGEMISILESRSAQVVAPGAEKTKADASRIVHWGAGKHPPFGTPEAPGDATILGSPLPDVSARLARTPQPLRPYTVKDPPPGGWPEAFSHEPPMAKKTDASVSSVPASRPAAPAITPVPAVTQSTKTPGTTTVPAAPVVKQAPVSTSPTPVVKQAPVSTSTAPVVKTPSVTSPATAAAAKTTAPDNPVASKWTFVGPPSPAPTPAVSATTTSLVKPLPATDPKPADPAKPAASDWHQSWGKVAEPKSPLLNSAAPPTPAPRKIDPLNDPESYSKVSVEDRIVKKLKETGAKEPEKSTADATPKPPANAPPVFPVAKTTTTGFQPAGAALGKLSTDQPTPASTTNPSSASKTIQKPSQPSVMTSATPPAPTPSAPARATSTSTVSTPVPAAPPWLPSPQALPAPAAPAAPRASATPVVSAPVPPVVTSVPATAVAPPAPRPAATPTASVPMMPPPPGVPMPPAPYVPAYISAASTAANDNSGNAFSAPRPATAPRSNAGTAVTEPPTISRMPGYTPVPGVAYAPEPPPRIAAAPSASVVAAGYPLVAQPNATPAALSPNLTSEQGTTSRELLIALRTSLYPSQREWAADRLTSCDWRAEPQVVDGLVTTARVDPAPLVRAGCLRALARMQAACPPAVAIAKELKSDADPRVRQEAEQTLNALLAKRPTRLNN